MTTEIDICNLSLGSIGVSTYLPDGDGTIAGSTATSTAALLFKRILPQSRDLLLREHFWQFARQYASLTQLSDGTGKEWADEWGFSYTYPTNCLRVRRLVDDVGDTSPLPWKWVVRNDGGTKVILTDYDEDEAVIEFTARQTTALDANYMDLPPESWRQALVHLLGMQARPTLAKVVRGGPTQADDADLYTYWLGAAIKDDANESEERDDPSSSFERARTL